ncbi:MAG: hypothetical protein DWQ05_14910 [Calditrichaeota bacterium]|nr:MAG: hypothetical protein DWQ05_14910 [Calditrichota bacterium]
MHNPFDFTQSILFPVTLLRRPRFDNLLAETKFGAQSPSKQAVANPLFCLDGFPIKAFGNDRI